MIEAVGGAVLILLMRVCDVSIGTMRTIFVIQGKKYYAAIAGFCEVLIWITAMKYIMQNLDNTLNSFGYATGFALGNIIGITLEQKIGMGYLQMNVISLKFSEQIADVLRSAKFGVTILPGEGGAGRINILILVIKRKHQKEVKRLIESVDSRAFISVQPSVPFRGFIHGSRK